MQNIQESIKKVLSKIIAQFFSVFGHSPQKYWTLMLVLFILLLIGAFILDGMVFQQITSSAFKEILIVSDTHLESINKEALSGAVSVLKDKDAAFSEAFSAAPVADPSF